MATPIETFYVNGFKGGWQPDLSQSNLSPDSVPLLSNMNFTEGLGLRKRNGFEQILVATTSTIAPAEHLFIPKVFTSTGEHPNFTQRVIYLEEDGGNFWIQEFGELLDEWTNGTGTDLTDLDHTMGVFDPSGVSLFRYYSLQCITYGVNIYVTGLRFGATSAGGTVDETDNALANGPSKPFKYNASTGVVTRPTVHLLDGSTTGFPAARACIVKYDRVFAANLYKISNYRYPSRIYWSDAGTSETFGTNSYIEVGGDDGSEITGLLPFGEQILIFKNTSTWVLLGATEDDFSLYSLESNLGCEATHGFVNYAGKAYFFDSRSGVWSYDGAQFRNISEPINNFLLDRLNREMGYKAGMHVNQERLFLTIPTLTSEENNETYIYDFRYNVWSRWDIGWGPEPDEYLTNYSVAGVGIPQDGQSFVARITPAGASAPIRGIFKLEETQSDISAVSTTLVSTPQAINGWFYTAWWNPGDVGDRHRIRRLDILADPDDEDLIDFIIQRELINETWQSGTLTPDNGYMEFHEQEIDGDVGLWTWIRFYFENDSLAQSFQINGVGMSVSNRRLLRGKRVVDVPAV